LLLVQSQTELFSVINYLYSAINWVHFLAFELKTVGWKNDAPPPSWGSARWWDISENFRFFWQGWEKWGREEKRRRSKKGNGKV